MSTARNLPARPRIRTPVIVASGVGLAFLAILAPPAARRARAHTPPTARYSFEEHIRPIFVQRCGKCHRPRGPAPMSLMTYEDARPWSESIKEHVLNDAMPPWTVRHSDLRFENDRALTAMEIDRIVDWTTGGAPRGEVPATVPTTVPAMKAGEKIELASGPVLDDSAVFVKEWTVTHLLEAETEELISTKGIELGNETDLWVRGFELEPSPAALVHDVKVDVIPRDATSADDIFLLFVWNPADPVHRYPHDAARRVSAGSRLKIRVRLKRPWHYPKKTSSVRTLLRMEILKSPPLYEVLLRKLGPTELESKSQIERHVGRSGLSLFSITPIVRPNVRPNVEGGGRWRVELNGVAAGKTTLYLRSRELDPNWPLNCRLSTPLELPPGVVLQATFDPLPLPAGAEVEVAPREPAALWLELLAPREPDGKHREP